MWPQSTEMEDKSYQPIFVDTYYEYELDMSLFPGINDPSAHMQPTLLTHQEENCLCKDIPDLPSLIGMYIVTPILRSET